MLTVLAVRQITPPGSSVSCAGTNAESGATGRVAIIDERQPFTMEPINVDAWVLKIQPNTFLKWKAVL